MSTSNLSATTPASPRTSRTMWPFAVMISVGTVVAFLQSAIIGVFLSGNASSLDAHRVTGISLAVIFLMVLVTSIIARWPGRGPIWPFYSSLGLVVLIVVQVSLGFTGLVALHVPLGVFIVVVSALAALQSWRLIRRTS